MENSYKSRAISISVITALTLQALIMPFFALAQNSGPVIEQEDFSMISNTSVTLIASVNPNGQYTYVKFEYGTTSSFGSSIDSNAGSAGSRSITVFVGGLRANTTYYYRVKAWNNNGGITYGNTVSFFTNVENPYSSGSNNNQNYNYNNGNNYNQSYGASPIVYTQIPSSITYNSASLNANINPQNGSTNYWFEYGTSEGYLNSKTDTQYLGNGSYAINASNYLYNLQPNTKYFYRVVAVNNFGPQATGSVVSFTTLSDPNQNYSQNSHASPTVTTNPASSVTANSVILNGTVNPNNGFTNSWFQYGTETSLSQTDKTEGFQSLPASNNVSNISVALSGLAPNTTYYYHIAAKNDYGVTSYGDTLSFMTGNDKVTGSSQASGTKNVVTVVKSTATNKPLPPKTVALNLSSSAGNISPVLLETDSIKPAPGEEFNYTVNYSNSNDSKVSQVRLRIILPSEVEYIGSSLPPATMSGKMLIFDLGDVGPNSQVFVTVKVKVSDAAKPGSNLVFAVVLEYLDSFGVSQSISSYLTVQVGEKNQNLSGSLAGLIAGLGDKFLLLVWLALGTFIIWLICYVIYRRYFKSGNGSSKIVTYHPPPTIE